MARGPRTRPADHVERCGTVDDTDLTAHRTRSNRRPDPPLHPGTVAEINDTLADIIEDRS